MRAIQYSQYGSPAEVLGLAELPIPEPGPGQVQVRMRARPINPADLAMIAGRYGIRPSLPATAGMEGSGVVSALGAGVTQLQVGQLVAPLGASGTWQEYIVADVGTLLPVPPGIDERAAAMLLVNPTTAWMLLHEVLHVQPGEWVLQDAANSAVGHFVIQLSRLAGFRTINVVRRRDVIDELHAIGADEVICEADEDVVARVRAITGGKGVRYALDSVSGESGARLAESLADDGRMIVFGVASGRPLAVNAGALLFHGAAIQGWWLSRWFRMATPEQIAGLFGAILPLIADGTLRAPVAGEFDLADVRAAVAAASGSERRGKVLLVG